jgi:hypothetical protein
LGRGDGGSLIAFQRLIKTFFFDILCHSEPQSGLDTVNCRSACGQVFPYTLNPVTFLPSATESQLCVARLCGDGEYLSSPY